MIGNILLTGAFLFSVFTVIMYYLTHNGYQNTLKIARLSFHVTSILVLAATALLFYLILTHQYQYKYVYNYSGGGMSTGMLMATFWAGQEGSFLLWILFTVIIGLILLDYTSKRGNIEPQVMMMFTLALAFLLIMVSPLLKTPFNYLWMEEDYLDLKNINPSFISLQALQSFIFTDTESNKSFVKMGKELYAVLVANNISVSEFIIQGKGLNPLLQNFWMQIHPPMLFVGFAMSLVPFAFATASLIRNDYKDWVKQSLPWLIAAMCVLGLGIMLGGYWAYSILGWGGYWGWDPVENSSLIPWIVGLAAIHTMIVQSKTQTKNNAGRFVKTNLILSILTFLLVIYSTFLTRSGILGDASVHSFVDPGSIVYLFLVIFLVSFTLIGAGGLIYRWKYLTQNFSYEENILSRELALFTGAVSLIASAVIILAGTSAPILGKTVEISFYNELNLPIAIIIGLLNGLSILLKWKTTQVNELWKESRISLSLSILQTILVIVFAQVYDIMLIILNFSSVFALIVNCEIAYKVFIRNKSHIGAYVSHIGFSLFLIGVLATAGFTQKEKVDLVKGENKSVLNHNLLFTGHELFENGKKYKFNVSISKGNSQDVISPVMFISEFNNSLTREPAILMGFSKDFYIEPVSWEEGNAAASGTIVSLKKGSSFNYEDKVIVFNQFNLPKKMEEMTGGGTFRIGASITVKSNGKEYHLEPYMENSGNGAHYIAAQSEEANLKVELTSMNASGGEIELSVTSLNKTETQSIQPKEILTIEASIKPFISFVWIGVLVMVIGFSISTYRRGKESVEKNV